MVEINPEPAADIVKCGLENYRKPVRYEPVWIQPCISSSLDSFSDFKVI